MMGAALRGGALVVLVCAAATSALAAGADVTDNDRVWANFTREAATVGDSHFWLELQGMKLESPGRPELGLNGYPLDDPSITHIDGGRFDLVGAYGFWGGAEVGADFPFVMQEQITSVGTEVSKTGELKRHHDQAVSPGDLLLYGKFKRELAAHWAGALGLELSAPTGSEDDFLGSGELGLNPFLSTRYQSGPFAVGGHVGFLLNTGNQADVFNWSLEAIARYNTYLAFRCELNDRLFRDGQTFNDMTIWPGLDLNLIDHLVIRPEGLAHLTGDAIDWGIGIGLAFTL
jgi:hypothetical protein